MVMLENGERMDFLLDEKMKIIQSSNVFSFSVDAVLLARFAYVPIRKGKIIDLCTGNGVIPLILSTRSKANIYGVEIQERLFDMARRSVEVNELGDQLEMVRADLNELPKVITSQQFDVVTCNPPYFETTSEKDQNENPHFAIARHEIYCTLEDVIRVSSKLLRQKGKLAIVHRPERLTDIMLYMRKYKIEPKRIQLVHPRVDKDANMVLVEGSKDGQAGVTCLPPIYVYGKDQAYTEEFKQIYYGESGVHNVATKEL
ncbi:tRNA1(Val) (adenine(37)-N6)-methyltransferase [Bacillus sp. FJAT-45350]|uniref:tRNA1(Val) (adenine(37)-N6)-methyltransferase n=1 Tax=Bacillus sp. FJAT-45350 TaxID=2011014 RepID=UPI000BB7C8A5|nr:tRNA1(Val) (adenine(37)-N6)-methyltransferase [Bacillus sp. FJAT-45350]